MMVAVGLLIASGGVAVCAAMACVLDKVAVVCFQAREEMGGAAEANDLALS